YGVAQEIAPGVRRIVANNPGPYTFLGTNSYIVGKDEVAVIDPGPADERHLNAIAAAITGERLAFILVTHSHRDHCDGARGLQALCGGKIASFGPAGTQRGASTPGLTFDFVDPDFSPDIALRDGEAIKGRDFTLDVLHMPGHAPDHLCFALVGKRTVFTGDHVMGWNTTVIAPPEGDMAQFMASLERLMQRHDRLFLPGHGGRIQTPQRVVKAYIMHRKWREQTILACLEDGIGTIPAIVARLYGGIDAELKGAAALSVLAHLKHLMERELVASDAATASLDASYWRSS
ncbi:MAG TPA: MBL fold metallo-hydrolase, partial [Methyloceanibacter sp.]|nr:MBL fold metallo-hydrolase [Methyloceanibacter sp.]